MAQVVKIPLHRRTPLSCTGNIMAADGLVMEQGARALVAMLLSLLPWTIPGSAAEG